MDIKKEENKKYTAGEIFEKINSIETLENKDYKFEWSFDNDLRYLTDKMIDVIYKLLEKGKFSLEESDKKDYLKNNSYISSLCDTGLTTESLDEKLKEGKYIQENAKSWIMNKYDFSQRLCVGCKYDRCPKFYAAYILYLKNRGLLLEKLKDRENYRNNEMEIDYFTFKWNTESGLKKIPENIYKFSEELVNRGFIYVSSNLKKGSINIYTPFSCSDITVTNGKIEELPTFDMEYSNWKRYIRSNNELLDFCNTFPCRVDGCPPTIAGYIYYLRKTNQEQKIIEDREYYSRNKEKIDKEFYRAKQEKILSIENSKNKNESIKNLKNINKIKNIDSLVEKLTIINQKNLHITLEGNDAQTKKEYEERIAKILFDIDKITSTNVTKLSLQNFAARNTHFEDESKFLTMPEKELFVITGIDEFIRDYRMYKSKENNYGTYIEGRKKQFAHALELLTDLVPKNYIILDSTEKEIDNLLKLNPKIQFAFQNSRFKIQEITVEEMFDMFLKGIKPDLLEIIRKEEERYKAKFIEYVSLNKNFLPFSELELVNYMVSYINTKDDVVFPENIYKKETVEESLRNIVGMESVKNKVKDFEKYMIFQMKAKSLGMKLQKSNLHMIFTGNPGTGKTTIARIMAKMLFDLGLIKENKLIEVERKDLIAGYIGQTALKTTEVIEKAIGGVLFIDEAYSLAVKDSSIDFGNEAIATLIKTMEDQKDKIVVIFAGYKNEMKTFIDSNPGIASRIGYTFDFPDYTSDELTLMFNKKMKNMGFKCEQEIEKEVHKICEYFSKRKAFGNGRFIDKLLQETIMKHSLNENEEINKITISDIPTIEELNNIKFSNNVAENLLENLVGMDELKKKIKEFEEYVKFIKEAENHKLNLPNQNLHMIFTGNPGTGKTTVARILAEILFEFGIIHENKLIEVERKDLIGKYVGHTAPKTAEVIEKALGGVLFIDEAYSLALSNSSHDFGGEAISTLIKAMEEHKGEFVVIFAGYKKEMKDFIEMNSGIASRIGYTFNFPDYTDIEYCEIFYKKVQNTGMTIDEEAKLEVMKLMKYFCNVENIGNGRFVDKVFQETLIKHSKNKERRIEFIAKEEIPTIQDMTKNIFNGNHMIDPSRITLDSQKRTAIHEIGHATLRYLLFENSGIKKITINAEGSGTLGYVLYKENIIQYTSSKVCKLNDITVKLGGMAAEQVFLGEFGSGNSSDLKNATYIAKEMITTFGMSSLGFGQIFNPDGVMAETIQKEINRILQECFDNAVNLIKENQTNIVKVVDYLMENKEIDEEQFIKVFENIE